MHYIYLLQAASKIRQEAEKTKETATYLKDQADILGQDVTGLETEIANREAQADDDATLTNNVSLVVVFGVTYPYDFGLHFMIFMAILRLLSNS